MLVRPDSNSRPPAWQPGAQPTEPPMRGEHLGMNGADDGTLHTKCTPVLWIQRQYQDLTRRQRVRDKSEFSTKGGVENWVRFSYWIRFDFFAGFKKRGKALAKSTVACNYLSTHLTKTCSAGQSKFKVLTIKLQSLPRPQRVRAFCLLQFWTPCLKFLPSLFMVNAMSSQTANKSATIICVTGTKTFPSGGVNFEVWVSKRWILIGWQNMFLSRVWTGSCKWQYRWFSITWWDGHVGTQNNSKF